MTAASTGTDTGTVLVVEHEPGCPPGRVGDWLQAAGLALDVRRPWRGEGLPADLHRHAGLLVLGGRMGANDDGSVPWLGPVKALVRGAAATGVPTLGICLGHQLAAVALGGRVERNPRERRLGVLPLGATGAPDPFLEPMPDASVFWNNDVVIGLPEGAVALAWSARSELQAARFAPTVWGVQCHPEVDEPIVRGWADRERERLSAHEVDVEARLEEIRSRQPELDRWWQSSTARWAALVADAGASRSASGTTNRCEPTVG